MEFTFVPQQKLGLVPKWTQNGRALVWAVPCGSQSERTGVVLVQARFPVLGDWPQLSIENKSVEINVQKSCENPLLRWSFQNQSLHDLYHNVHVILFFAHDTKSFNHSFALDEWTSFNGHWYYKLTAKNSKDLWCVNTDTQEPIFEQKKASSAGLFLAIVPYFW